MPRLNYHHNLCTACRSCELACAFINFQEFNPAKAKIKIYLDRSSGSISLCTEENCIYTPDCREFTCTNYCPSGALYTTKEV